MVTSEFHSGVSQNSNLSSPSFNVSRDSTEISSNFQIQWLGSTGYRLRTSNEDGDFFLYIDSNFDD